MPKPQKPNDWKTLKRLFAYFKGEERNILWAVISLVFYAVASAIGPAIIAKIFDQNITTSDLQGLNISALQLLGVYLASLLMMRLQLKYLGKLGQRILFKIRNSIFSTMQRLPLDFYYKNESGDLMSRLLNDTDSLSSLFSQSIIQTLSSVLGLIAIVIAMFSMNVKLSLVACAILPVMVWLSLYFARKSRKAFAKSRVTLGNLSSNIEENLRLVRESQAFARQAINIHNFELGNSENRDAQVEAVKITALFAPTIDILSTLAMIAVISYGSYLAFHGEVTIGLVVAFLVYSQRFYRPIQMLASFYTQLQSTLAAADRVFEVLDQKSEETDTDQALHMPRITGKVSFDNVFFGYDKENQVLKGISFTAQPGENVALIGETGVGKSTSINLIPRYYKVDQGQLRIDDVDVDDVSLHSLRTQIAEVPQSSFLFSLSIAENISYGDPNPDMDRIKNAAEIAQCKGFIEELEHGYDSILGAEGVRISQGQRQLLCIARAVYSDPRILLLDEATSSIDTQTEKDVQKAIQSILKGRTSFIIAHRLSTISQVDTIITLGPDGILEKGSPEQLRETGGYYAKMLQNQ